MQKLTALKYYLNELENQLLLVENRRSTWMLTTEDGSVTRDIFNLKFISSDQRLPRKRKKTMKRRLEQNERPLKEWGAEF